jgi:hypothetical protein
MNRFYGSLKLVYLVNGWISGFLSNLSPTLSGIGLLRADFKTLVVNLLVNLILSWLIVTSFAVIGLGFIEWFSRSELYKSLIINEGYLGEII